MLAGGLITALSHVFARWQGNPAAAGGYAVIAPAVFFAGLVAGFRGWFQGEMYMLPTALSGIVEQLVKLGVGVGLAAALAPRGQNAAVMGAIAGVTVSEFAAACYLAVTCAVRRKKKGGMREGLRLSAAERRAMFRTAAPIALLGVIVPLGAVFDSLIVVNALKWGGADTASATAMYGLYSGPVTSLVNLPVVAAMSLAIAVVPSVSASREERDLGGILAKSRMSVEAGLSHRRAVVAFSHGVGRDILALIYPSLSSAELSTAAKLLAVAAFGVVLTGATQIYVSLLQALDKTKALIISLSFAVLVKVALSLSLVSRIGVMGAAVAGVGMSAVSLVAVTVTFRRLTGVGSEKKCCPNTGRGCYNGADGAGGQGVRPHSSRCRARGCGGVGGRLRLARHPHGSVHRKRGALAAFRQPPCEDKKKDQILGERI